MILVISPAPDGTTRAMLDEPDDCTRFHVSSVGIDRDRLALALTDTSIGTLRGEEAYLDPAAIERLAGDDLPHDWPDRFAGMLAYAERKGWVAEDGAVQAHVEYA